MQGNMLFARRRTVEQRTIRRFAANEFHQIQSVVTVARNDLNDLSGMLAVMGNPVVKERLKAEMSGVAPDTPSDVEDTSVARLSEEEKQEQLTAELRFHPPLRVSLRSMYHCFGAR